MYTIMKVSVPALYGFVGVSYQQDPSTVKTYHVFKTEIKFRVKSAFLYIYVQYIYLDNLCNGLSLFVPVV